MPKSSPPDGGIPAAIFDFDGTVLREDSARLLAWEVVRRFPAAVVRLIPLVAAAGAWGLGVARRETVKLSMLSVLEQVPTAQREEFLREFHTRVLVPRYLPPARERMEWHRSRGHRVLLVSASVDFYLRHAARHLGVDRLVCTPAAHSPRVKLLGPNCRGREKVHRLNELRDAMPTDWPESWAYSDSLSDRPLLDLCGHPVAVNPSRALRREAARRGWPAMEW